MIVEAEYPLCPSPLMLDLWLWGEREQNENVTHTGFRQKGWVHTLIGGWRLADIQVAAYVVYAFRALAITTARSAMGRV
jgi:hypothetical protein